MQNQDWNQVVFNSNNNKQGTTVIVKKPQGGVDLRKVEKEDYVPPKMTTELKIKIQQARVKKGWSQKELASKIQVKPSVINSYESGTAIPESAMLVKLSRALGVTLRK